MTDRLYEVGSSDYLHRARERLDDKTSESLFYAAFELRCGIEARMQQYLEVQEALSKKKKTGWRIAVLGKITDKFFRTRNKIGEFSFFDKSTGKKIGTLYYTPITSHLRKMAEQLGSLLHAAQKLRGLDDSWWDRTRTYLGAVYAQLRIANLGTLLGVPLRNRKTGQLKMYYAADGSEAIHEYMKKLGLGGKLVIKVRYLDDIPATLKQST